MYKKMFSKFIYLFTLHTIFIKTLHCKEYCTEEIFKTNCQPNELPLLLNARYGRMKIGRCITEAENLEFEENVQKNPKYLGCFASALNYLDPKCSILNNGCYVKIPIMELKSNTSCFQQLSMYLDAEFKCIEVVQQERSCQVSVSEEALHLSSNFKPSSGCGSKNQPWHLQATSGQIISVELITLGVAAGQGVAPASVQCREELGHVIDRKKPKNVPICASEERFSEAHKSASNELQLVLHQNQQKNFILKFYAKGCVDLKPASDAWMKREGDVTTIGCHATRQTWLLHCKEARWMGVIGNCTQQLIGAQNEDNLKAPLEINNTESKELFLIVGATCISIIVILIITCFCLLCLQRRHLSKLTTAKGYYAGVGGAGAAGYKGATIKSGEGMMAPMMTHATPLPLNQQQEYEKYFVLDQEYVPQK